MSERAIGVRVQSDFPSTQWQVVLDARGDGSGGRAALGVLCKEYWYPIYAFVRRRVGKVDRAEELTQGFFEDLLTRGVVACADQARGRFRDFLLACCRRYVSTRRRRERARKNGGGVAVLPLDFAAAEARFKAERAGSPDPERQFVRTWALAVLGRTTTKLRAAYAAEGTGDLFDRLSRTLTGDPEAEKYAEIGAALGRTVDQVKKAAARLRERFGAELRQQVGQTLADPANVDDEIRELFRAVGPE